ncbi:hypothetical protein [Vibrio sp. 10N.247.311.26]|uniref:hypothetical protein n=1 Tax=Vibrio sp. 10N.247.311.26 TaxID=3229995 RepID=UPI0035543ECE
MKYSEEISKLVIKNLDQHEKAALVLFEVGEVVSKAINKEAKELIEAFALDGNEYFNFDNEDKDICFSLKDWMSEDPEEMTFGISLNYYDPDEKEPNTWLGHFCGVPYKSTGLYLHFWVDRRHSGIRLPRFKQILREHFEASTLLIENGFKLSADGQTLDRVFTLKQEEILANYPHDLSEALSPLTESIKAFERCQPDFMKLVEALKKESQE